MIIPPQLYNSSVDGIMVMVQRPISEDLLTFILYSAFENMFNPPDIFISLENLIQLTHYPILHKSLSYRLQTSVHSIQHLLS